MSVYCPVRQLKINRLINTNSQDRGNVLTRLAHRHFSFLLMWLYCCCACLSSSVHSNPLENVNQLSNLIHRKSPQAQVLGISSGRLVTSVSIIESGERRMWRTTAVACGGARQGPQICRGMSLCSCTTHRNADLIK